MMKKGLTLVLSIYEGRSWQPIEGYKTSIEAKLDTNYLQTDLVPLTSNPKFNTELTWEADKQTIRNYKLNRVPVKIECFARNSSGSKKIGYIILPLLSVEGVQIDSKWHKLLGTTNAGGKNPPELLLSLSLEASIPNSGNENCEIPLINLKGVEKMNHKYLNANGHKSYTSTNGSVGMSRGNARNEESKNLRPIKASGSYDEKNDDEYDSDMDEEDLGSYVDSEDDYMMEDEYYPKGEATHARQEGMAASNGPVANEARHTHKSEESVQSKEKAETVKSPEPVTEPRLDESQSSPFAEASCSEIILKNIESRASNRKLLEKISKENKQKNIDNIPERIPFKRKEIVDGKDAPTSIKAIEDVGYSFDPSLLRSYINQHSVIKATSNGITSTSTANAITSSLASVKPKVSQVINYPSTSGSQKHSGSNHVKDHYKSPSYSKLVAELSSDGTYFQIGDKNEPEQSEFELSVQLVSVEDLDKVISSSSSDSETGYHFSYTLLDCRILTETFYNKSEVDCSVQTSAATIHSTLSNLFKYISQHSNLEISLMCGNRCIATSTVSMRQLLQITSSSAVSKVKGLYPLLLQDKESQAVDEDCSAVLGVSLQLKWYANTINENSRSSAKIPISRTGPFESSRQQFSSAMYPEIKNGSNSDTSLSDDEAMEISGLSKGFYRESRFLEKRMRDEDLIRNRMEQEFNAEKQALMQQFVIEVNDWKETQKLTFLKEWSKKEAELQSHLSREWHSRVAIVEGDMSHRLQECDKLQEKLTQTLSDLSIREKSVHEREIKVGQLEACMKERMNATAIPSKEAHQAIPDIGERLKIDAKIAQLEGELLKAREKIIQQTQETIELRKKIIQTNDRDDLIRERDILSSQLSKSDERKKYYKTQWIRAIKETHRVLKFNEAAMGENRLCRVAEEALGVHPSLELSHHHHYEPSPVSSRRELRLRKLKEERKVLMQSGNISSQHPMLQSVNRRIRAMERRC